jgi:hypothetical protein
MEPVEIRPRQFSGSQYSPVGPTWAYAGPYHKRKRGSMTSAGGKNSGGAKRVGRTRFLAVVRAALAQSMAGRRFNLWDGIS